MQKSLAISAWTLTLALIAGCAGRAHDSGSGGGSGDGAVANEALAEHLAALGGAEEVVSLGPRVIHGTIEAGGRRGSFRTHVVPDGRYRSTAIFGDRIERVGFDGERAWVVDEKGEPRMLSGRAADAVILRAALESMRYLDTGWGVLRAGSAPAETLAELPHDVIVLVAPAGGEMRLLLDRAEGLIRRSVLECAAGRIVTDHEDYRSFGRLPLAHRFERVATDPRSPAPRRMVEQIDPILDLVDTLFEIPPQPLVRDHRLAGGDRALGIAIEVREGSVLVPVSIDGGPPLTFALDTSGKASCLDTESAHRSGLAAEGETLVTRQSLRVGGLEIRSPSFVVRDIGGAAEAPEQPIDGLLGSDFFHRLVVELDFTESRMHLFDPATYRHTGAGGELRLAFVGGAPRVVGLANRRLPGRFLIDLGRAESTIHEGELLRALLEHDSHAPPEAIRLELFTLAGRIVPDLALLTREGKGLDASGSLGLSVWRSFDLVIDHSGGRAWVELAD